MIIKVEDSESIGGASHMPSTFLKEDQKRIAEAALIVEVGLHLEVIADRQTIEQNILRFNQIILGQAYGRQPQQWSGT